MEPKHSHSDSNCFNNRKIGNDINIMSFVVSDNYRIFQL